MSTNNLSIVQRPIDPTVKTPVITNWTPMLGYMIYKNQNVGALFFYKLRLEVYLGSDSSTGTLIARLKQRRNGYSVDVAAGKARAFFDIKEIVNSQLVNTYYDQNLVGLPFSTIHKVGANVYNDVGDPAEYYIFSVSGDRRYGLHQVDEFYVTASDCYSVSGASAAICYTPTTAVEDSAYYMQASLPLHQPRGITATTDPDADYTMGIAFQSYSLNGGTKSFLSDNPLVENVYGGSSGVKAINKVYDGDYHTLAFLNNEDVFDSKPAAFIIKYYNGSNLLQSTSTIDNIEDNGGFDPTTTGVTATNDRKLLYFGCGPGNLEGFVNTDGSVTHQPSDNNLWVSYTVQAVDASDNPVSQEIVFARQSFRLNKYSECTRYPIRRLAWRNSLGGYDYFNFTLKSTQTTDVERNKYAKMLGTFDKSKYYYASWQTGDAVRQTTARKKETLNTNFITEAEGVLIEKLFMSTDVFILENSSGLDPVRYTEAVTITDSSFIKKTVVNDTLIQYSITIEYSNEINTNS
tara:strand:- start:3332 stop:4888 length:1557 start_codon:yes stop_codon:yes gene_type:complete